MPTPIQIQATKLEIPYSLSQLDNKKNEIAALVESLSLTFEGEQLLYDTLVDLGIEQTKEGEQYDSIDVSKSAGVAPVTLKVTEHPVVGLSINKEEQTSLVAVQPLTSIGVSIEESNDIDVQTKEQLSVTVINPNKYVHTGGTQWGEIGGNLSDQTDLFSYIDGPKSRLDMVSQNGTLFTIVVSNDGNLLVIPEGSTAPAFTSAPTITGTQKVWYTLTALSGTITGSPTPDVAYQWQRSTDGNLWVDITGETSTTYTLADADANNYIRIQQTASNVLGSVVSNSAPTGQIISSIFATTQYQNIAPITWEQLTVQTWN